MRLESAARAVLEGANSLYGDAWRSWATHPGATTQGQAFSAALLALEASLKRLDACPPLSWTDAQVLAEIRRITRGEPIDDTLSRRTERAWLAWGAGAIHGGEAVTPTDHLRTAHRVTFFGDPAPPLRDELASLERARAGERGREEIHPSSPRRPRPLGRAAATIQKLRGRLTRPTD